MASARQVAYLNTCETIEERLIGRKLLRSFARDHGGQIHGDLQRGEKAGRVEVYCLVMLLLLSKS